jgi:hypothetical protein
MAGAIVVAATHGQAKPHCGLQGRRPQLTLSVGPSRSRVGLSGARAGCGSAWNRTAGSPRAIVAFAARTAQRLRATQWIGGGADGRTAI